MTGIPETCNDVINDVLEQAHGATRRRFLLSTSTSMSTFFGHGGTLQANSAEASPQPDGAAQNPFIAGVISRNSLQTSLCS